MADDTLKNYIKRGLEKGYAPEQIKKTLMDAGWHPDKIRAYIGEFSSKPPKKFVMALILLIFAILAVYFVYSGIKSDTNEKIQSYIDKGNRLCSENKYQEAQLEFDKALQLNQTKSRIYYYKGKCYESIGKYEEAIAQL